MTFSRFAFLPRTQDVVVPHRTCSYGADPRGPFVDSLIVVGDTASDMQAGRRAGARLCVGVLTGTDDAQRLRDNGADEVVDSITDLLDVESVRNAVNP